MGLFLTYIYIYFFLMGLAKIHRAAGRWLAAGASSMAAKCIWVLRCVPAGRVVGLAGERSHGGTSWGQASSPGLCFLLLSIVFNALVGMLAATDAAQNQYSA